LYAGDSHKFMLANCSQMFLQCSCSCEPLWNICQTWSLLPKIKVTPLLAAVHAK
jgi:hypothetical protein